MPYIFTTYNEKNSQMWKSEKSSEREMYTNYQLRVYVFMGTQLYIQVKFMKHVPMLWNLYDREVYYGNE
jgi:hypothetical protein